MRYPCLVMDHDDTVVNSTTTIHYPCFIEFLNQYFPGKTISLDDYFLKNFDPGFLAMCREEFGMEEPDLVLEQEFWHAYVENHIPEAYDGMWELLWRQVADGGCVCVVSHSKCDHILRDWRENDLPEPRLVFGWDDPPALRKPNPYPLQTIMGTLGFRPEELLMVDDLKPGCDMAQAVGVDFVAAGWATRLAPIEAYMRRNCTHYAPTVQALSTFLYGCGGAFCPSEGDNHGRK